jgi:hypothetical protein
MNSITFLLLRFHTLYFPIERCYNYLLHLEVTNYLPGDIGRKRSAKVLILVCSILVLSSVLHSLMIEEVYPFKLVGCEFFISFIKVILLVSFYLDIDVCRCVC